MHGNHVTMETHDLSICATYLPKRSLVICREGSSLVINQNSIEHASEKQNL